MMGRSKRGGEGDEPVEEWTEEQPVEGTEELGLDDDERLPWLESSDYDDEPQGVDTGRILGFLILAVLLLAVVLGGGWYFLNRGADGDQVADGSTIEAPEGPYKERPEDPGGRIAEGTGDVAPAVGEGQSREGRLARAEEPQAPAQDREDEAARAPAPTGVGVQVGAFSNRETAERGWATLNRQTEALSGVKYRIVEGQADIGKVFRLQAVAGDLAAARRLCNALEADGVACQVKR